MNDPRTLRLTVVATKEDNPWLPDDVTTKRGITVCGPIVDQPHIDEAVDMELRNAGIAILHHLRKHDLLPPRQR